MDSTTISNTYNWSGKTILVAEDVEFNFLLIKAILQKANATIIWAMNGKIAVEKCQNGNKIDAILMDIRMPVMDGYQATKEIRKILPNVPIITQTAYGFEDEKERMFEAGCNEFILKPIDAELVFKLINSYFEISI